MKFIFVLLLIVLVLPFISSAHYVVGVVNNALDSGNANDLQVVLWNPLNGINDNLTGIIGVNGNSGQDNFYMIDCEALNTACSIGDTINVKVLSYPYSVNVSLVMTGGGYDFEPNITLNSLPNSSLVSPVDFANVSSQTIDFNCSFEDLDSNIASVSLYGNWSGGWHLNETKAASGGSGSVVFNENVEEGIYKWGCLATDDLSASTFSEENYTLTIDRTPPLINSITLNETYLCGNLSYVRVTCNTTDFFGIGNVIIEAKKPDNSLQNYSATFLSGDNYYSDIFMNQTGSWDFNCISKDYSNNSANLSLGDFEVYSGGSELRVYPMLNFSNLNPLEGESIILNATILNEGCSDANNFLVGFFEGDPLLGNQIGSNQTISIPGLLNYSVNVSWISKVGPTNFFIFSDVGNSINENNETDNLYNESFNVGVWQEFYGNVSGMKFLSDGILNNITVWQDDPNIEGNIFMTDMESQIDWLSLVAIGRDDFGGERANDFNEIDSFLGTENFTDSVENVFTTGGNPILTENFTIHHKQVDYVPVVNSTNNSLFFTGILWDSSDDSDGEYGTTDKEDIVFVAKLNKGAIGTYGTYDYELKVPVNLRNYDPTNNEDVYLYYDLT